MRTIRLILDTPKSSIGYNIDVEKMQYTSGGFSRNGVMDDVQESGEITDAAVLAKRLYLVIHAALSEPSEVVAENPAPKEADG